MGSGGDSFERFAFVLRDDDQIGKIVEVLHIDVYDDTIVGFSLQHSAMTPSGWRQVIRVDTAHGVPHVHRFGRSGSESRTEWPDLAITDALWRANRLVVDLADENLRRWGRDEL